MVKILITEISAGTMICCVQPYNKISNALHIRKLKTIYLFIRCTVGRFKQCSVSLSVCVSGGG